MSFPISIVEFPKRSIVGISVQTDMQNAMQDCSALWQKFGEQVLSQKGKEGGDSFNGDSYGISEMIDENRFIYRAVIEANQNITTEGLELGVLPQQLYVKCTVPSLVQLKDAYEYLYGAWPNETTEYALDYSGASIERYPSDWNMIDPIELL